MNSLSKPGFGAAEFRTTGKIWPAALLFTLMIAFFAWDHASELHAGVSLNHTLIELAILVVAFGSASYLWDQLQKSRRIEHRLADKLEIAEKQVSEWQHKEHELIQNVRQAIDRQFEAWNLNESEREIAWSLLKGLSMKDIAKSRDSTDRSIRQQAYVLYRKAGLAGRAELSAYFLGGLIHPEEPLS